jgi:pyridoxamine 5'-phosphate oxidase
VAYFDVRPLQSRIGALASPQSRVIASREALEARVQEIAAVVGEHPKRPENWGGYRVIPDELEFWQGQPSRLHDRIRFRRIDGGWQLDRLAP